MDTIGRKLLKYILVHTEAKIDNIDIRIIFPEFKIGGVPHTIIRKSKPPYIDKVLLVNISTCEVVFYINTQILMRYPIRFRELINTIRSIITREGGNDGK